MKCAVSSPLHVPQVFSQPGAGNSAAIHRGKPMETLMKTRQTHFALTVLLALGLALAACSQATATPASSPTTATGATSAPGLATATRAAAQPTPASAQSTPAAGNPTVAPKPTVEGGGEGGVESALVTYS